MLLSVLIPARNEKYLQKTITNVLENIEGDTEIIAVLDGYWADPPIQDHPRVRLIHNSESKGQRQSVNDAARIAKGKYLMKLDAHCALDKGFDVKLAEHYQEGEVHIPTMYNLDVTTWKPKLHKKTDYMYFGWNEKQQLRSLYYSGRETRELNKRKEMIDETMGCMGPCRFMSAKTYWDLGGCDEEYGSWGSEGIEWACKAWLSGGRMMVNKYTWFAHWFRGGGVPKGETRGFPYDISGNQVERARKRAEDIWLNNKWEKQTRTIEWLVKKFNPPGWENYAFGRPPGDWYQEATINGVEMPLRKGNERSEDKWNVLIEPFVEKGEGRFTDIGCNAGFFCRKMADLGYTSEGVENDPIYVNQGKYWEEQDPKGVRIVQSDVKDYEVKASHTTLLANIHYWLTPQQNTELVKQLRENSMKVIVIGRYKQLNRHKSPVGKEYLRELFEGWEVEGIKERGKHFSICFKNPDIVQKDIDDLHIIEDGDLKTQLYPSFSKYVHEIIDGIEDETQTDYCKYLKERGFKGVRVLLRRHRKMITYIHQNGIKEPITIKDNGILDGDHRYIVAKELGIKKVICTTLQSQ